MTKHTGYIVAGVLLLGLSCKTRMKTSVIRDQKDILLFQDKPANAIVIKPFYDSTFTFYFDKVEWQRSVAKIIHSPLALLSYNSLLDLLQGKRGSVSFKEIFSTEDRSGIMQPMNTTYTIFDSLLHAGHCYVESPDSSQIPILSFYRKKVVTGEIDYFDDKSSRRTIYYHPKKTEGTYLH